MKLKTGTVLEFSGKKIQGAPALRPFLSNNVRAKQSAAKRHRLLVIGYWFKILQTDDSDKPPNSWPNSLSDSVDCLRKSLINWLRHILFFSNPSNRRTAFAPPLFQMGLGIGKRLDELMHPIGAAFSRQLSPAAKSRADSDPAAASSSNARMSSW